MGLGLPSWPFVTFQHHVEVLARALPPMLKCCGVGRSSRGVADAMIEAQSVFVLVTVGGITSTGGQASQSDRTTLAPWQHAHVLNPSIQVVVWTHRRWTD